MKLDNLHNLFLLELHDLYDAEQQITQAIPQMLEFTLSDELKEAFASHLEETNTQIRKLEEVCKSLGVDPTGKTCMGMEGILEEATN